MYLFIRERGRERERERETYRSPDWCSPVTWGPLNNLGGPPH